MTPYTTFDYNSKNGEKFIFLIFFTYSYYKIFIINPIPNQNFLHGI